MGGQISMQRYLFVAIFLYGGFVFSSVCHAEFLAFLGDVRFLAGEQFESDFYVAASPDLLDGELEFISIDVSGSRVGSLTLPDYSRIQFNSLPSFESWQGAEQFGVRPLFESRIVLDGFNLGALPLPISDTAPFQIGTITFDYSGLGLQSGDTVTLDVTGVNDGSTLRTTNLVARSAGSPLSQGFNPSFASSLGPGTRTITISSVPEPRYFGLALITGLLAIRRKRSLPQFTSNHDTF